MPRADPIPELKRQLAVELARRMAGWNAWDIACRIGIDQPRVSDLRRGKLTRFSLESLIRLIERLGYEVELRVTKRVFVRPTGRST